MCCACVIMYASTKRNLFMTTSKKTAARFTTIITKNQNADDVIAHLTQFMGEKQINAFLAQMEDEELIVPLSNKLKAFTISVGKTHYLVAAKFKKDLASLLGYSSSSISGFASEVQPHTKDYLLAINNPHIMFIEKRIRDTHTFSVEKVWTIHKTIDIND